jgi:hypothetical protein
MEMARHLATSQPAIGLRLEVNYTSEILTLQEKS